MDAYKHGFVVKSQKELEELMGPIGGESWSNCKDEWADSFLDDMEKYIGRPFFGEASVVTDGKGKGSKICNVWGWNFDTRWVHPLKRCTFEDLIDLSIPFDNVYAVCVPDDIYKRISMRAGLSKDDIDLVTPEVAVALENIVVPDHSFSYLTFEVVNVIKYLGYLWLPNELEVLYVEPAKDKVILNVSGEEYLEKYKGKGLSYRIFGYSDFTEVEYIDMSIFDKTYKTSKSSTQEYAIFADRYVIPLFCFYVKVETEV